VPIGDQIFHHRKRFHRLDRDRLIEREVAHPRHAEEPRQAVDLRRTRTALAGFAVPAAGKIVRLLRLNVMHRVENDHAFGDFGGVVTKFPARGVAAPDFEGSRAHRRFLPVIPSEVEESREVTVKCRHGILRLRCAPLSNCVMKQVGSLGF
jgi:hypothetical protein